MIPTSLRRRFSPSMLLSAAALFAALGGAGYAATGGNFILGQANTADQPTTLTSSATTGPALALASTSTKPAASFIVKNNKVAPFTVNSPARVSKLNADLLDGVDSTGFLRSSLPLSLTGSDGTGVVQATDTGSGNGVYGKSGYNLASGVYGENTGGGYGLAGR